MMQQILPQPSKQSLDHARINQILSKLANETNEMNLERRRVFYEVYEQSNGNIEQAIKYSNIRINIKYMKCTYPEQIMDKLQTYLNNFGKL